MPGIRDCALCLKCQAERNITLYAILCTNLLHFCDGLPCSFKMGRIHLTYKHVDFQCVKYALIGIEKRPYKHCEIYFHNFFLHTAAALCARIFAYKLSYIGSKVTRNYL